MRIHMDDFVDRKVKEFENMDEAGVLTTKDETVFDTWLMETLDECPSRSDEIELIKGLMSAFLRGMF